MGAFSDFLFAYVEKKQYLCGGFYWKSNNPSEEICWKSNINAVLAHWKSSI